MNDELKYAVHKFFKERIEALQGDGEDLKIWREAYHDCEMGIKTILYHKSFNFSVTENAENVYEEFGPEQVKHEQKIKLHEEDSRRL